MGRQVSVDVGGISKRFRLYHQKYQSLKERVLHAGQNPYTDFWALRDIDLQVYEGETLGILGRNGSGKSTLLKCISGILQPTEGKVVVRGSLAALLELGAGFQPDLSGRENIFLNASLLGMSTRETARRFDEIVAFAELEQFIDNQVKFYSSGMYIRLGFAVAVNVDPDILVVDEVLAVGDESFQRKCMERVKRFQEEGRTIIFVSHSPDQVRSICDRAAVLDEGHLVGLSTPGEAVRVFREHLLAAGAPASEVPPEPSADVEATAAAEAHQGPVAGVDVVPEQAPVRITEVTTHYPGSSDGSHLLTGQDLEVRVEFEVNAPKVQATFVIEIRDQTSGLLVHTDTDALGQSCELEPGRGEARFGFESFPFLDGTYDVTVGVMNRLGGVLFDWREQACRFEVVYPGRDTGMVSLPVHVELRVGSDSSGDSSVDDAARGLSTEVRR